jgi:Mrp family chromosome partitioning ATPase
LETIGKRHSNTEKSRNKEETKPMTKIISVHSFRGGTGKSNTSANIAAMLVAEG